MQTDLAALGGLLFLMSFWHFIVDWGFQTHKEAIKKSLDHKVRAKHCTIYTVGMAPLMYLAMPDTPTFGLSLFILWFSHFLIDTYVPVYLWAKYLRRHPTFWKPDGDNAIDFLSKKRHVETEADKFRAMFSTPIGLFLGIAIDQAFHLMFLVPLAGAAVWPTDATTWNLVAIFMTTLLSVMVASGARDLKTGS